MVVIHGFVTAGRLDRPDQRVRRVLTERQGPDVVAPAEVAVDGLANDDGDRHAAASGVMLQLAVGGLGKSEVGGDVPSHCGTTIPRAPGRDKPGIDRADLRAGSNAWWSRKPLYGADQAAVTRGGRSTRNRPTDGAC